MAKGLYFLTSKHLVFPQPAEALCALSPHFPQNGLLEDAHEKVKFGQNEDPTRGGHGSVTSHVSSEGEGKV